MSKGHHWQVWVTQFDEDGENPKDIVLCEGSHAKCLSYWKKHRKVAGLETHLGYMLED